MQVSPDPDAGIVRTSALDRTLRMTLGPAQAAKYARLDLHTARDLIEHYPRKAVDPSTLTDLSSVRLGEKSMIVVDVVSLTARPMRNRKGSLVLVKVTDGVRELDTVFFAPHKGRVTWLEQRLVPGLRITVDGKVASKNGVLQIVHPDVEDVDTSLRPAELEEQLKRPKVVYALTSGLENRHIKTAIHLVLGQLADADLPDPVPAEVRAERNLLSHAQAIRSVHEPESWSDYRAAVDALRFEEAFVLQAAMARRRLELAAQPATARPARARALLDAFDAALPFDLTTGQREVGAVIAGELTQTTPMHRLLQGEVGSGKTLVALRAMLQVVDAGGQAALLAPTEVLAAQHERSIRQLLGALGEGGMLGGADHATRVTLLTGSMPQSQRRRALADAAGGAAGIVIGTHALIQEHVQFADLGLVVVDEQHRFGVEQRDALRAKGRTTAHLLVMTATPIPRTVAMSIFGDLEVSTLRELPAGRAEVKTYVVHQDNQVWWERMWRRVAEEVAKGGRAYVVCPRISATAVEAGEELLEAPSEEENDDGAASPAHELASVEATAELLRAHPALADLAIGTLHGRMTPEEKESAMADFADGRTPILVATTVVEVGVDVPEATVMVVLDADRFGLSQLHQLRGRIGRGALPGVCFAVTALPESRAADGAGRDTLARLETFAGTRDGFVLAEADLLQRREGDVLGAAQHGRSSALRLLRVVADEQVIVAARDAARQVVDGDPTLAAHPALAAAIERAVPAEREEFLERS